MSVSTTARRAGPVTPIVVVLTVVAFLLRFWRLGQWSLDSDETFTLRDSLHPQLSNPRPLLYFLNYYLVRPFHALDEFGLRILPAVFGVLAIPVFYLVARRLFGARAALFGALLLTFSPLHVFYSQFARYWTLVFLLSTIYPYALYVGFRERNRSALALGAVTAVIAVLAHPTSALLIGGLGLWFVLTYLRGDNLRQLWNQRIVRWGVSLTVILAAAITVWLLPMLQTWISNHDGGNSSEFLLHLPGKPGTIQLAYLLSYVESLTLPLVLTALLGICLLWQGRDRSVALLLACIFMFPVAFLVLISFRTPVSNFYLVPPIPVVFFGAGVFFDRLAAGEWELRPRWLLPATAAVIVMAAGTPTLVSQYRDGRRYDYRSTTRWLNEQLEPGDIVFSDQPKVVEHYLPDLEAEYLRADIEPLMQSLRDLRDSGAGKALWIVSPAPAHAFRTNPKLGTLQGWIYANCQLRNTIGVGRVDFRQYHLQIFRCPVTPPSEDDKVNVAMPPSRPIVTEAQPAARGR